MKISLDESNFPYKYICLFYLGKEILNHSIQDIRFGKFLFRMDLPDLMAAHQFLQGLGNEIKVTFNRQSHRAANDSSSDKEK